MSHSRVDLATVRYKGDIIKIREILNDGQKKSSINPSDILLSGLIDFVGGWR
jgi:hypothetical protein